MDRGNEYSAQVCEVFKAFDNKNNVTDESHAIQLLSQLPTEQVATLENNVSGKKWMLLHHACYNGWYVAVKLLVDEYMCDVTIKDKDSSSLLHLASEGGNIDVVKYLACEKHCTPHQKNDYGLTSLHSAALAGNEDIAKFLVLDQKCDPSCKDNDGWTPLHSACKNGHLNVVKFLILDQKCDPSCKNTDKCGWTPLHLACYNGRLDIAKFLVLDQKCDPTYKDNDGWTSLHSACYNGHLDVVKFLILDHKCDPSSKGNGGWTPLHLACANGFLSVARFLVLEEICDPMCKDNDGSTPLHLACFNGRLDIAKFLIVEQKCDPSCKDKYYDGLTPLDRACQNGHLDVVKFLLTVSNVSNFAAKISIDLPQFFAEKNQHHAIAEYLKLNKDQIQHSPALKIFIVGEQSVGKSTLAKAVELKLSKRFNITNEVSGVKSSTAGIDPIHIHGIKSGHIVIYDFAGHREYYSSHGTIMNYLGCSTGTVFLIVIDLSKSTDSITSSLSYWYLFIKNVCTQNASKSIYEGTQTPLLYVVGSHSDVVEAKRLDPNQKLLNVFAKLDPSVSESLKNSYFVLNCTKLRSHGLGPLCDTLTQHSNSFHEQTKLNLDIQLHLFSALIKQRFRNKVACQLRYIAKSVAADSNSSFRDNDLLPTTYETMSQSLKKLAQNGEFVYLENSRHLSKSWLILNKTLLLSEINGTIFAPENFKQHHTIANNTGVVPLIKIKEIFPKHSSDMIAEFLIHLEFCQKLPKHIEQIIGNCQFGEQENIKDETYYFFPALISENRPADIYSSAHTTDKRLLYTSGWCIRCVNKWEFFTQHFLHILLLRIAFQFALPPDQHESVSETCPVIQRECNMWKTGIQWLKDGVEAIVELVDQSKTVVVKVGCPEGKEMACVCLRSELIKIVRQVKDEFTCKVEVQEYLINPDQLNNLEYGTQSLHTFSLKRLAKMIRDGKDDVTSKCDTDLKSIGIEKLLYFEPYMCTCFTDVNSEILNDKFVESAVSNKFLYKIKNETKLTPSYVYHFKEMLTREFGNNKKAIVAINKVCELTVSSDPAHQCSQLLSCWRKHIPVTKVYRSLKSIFDKYTIFCDKNLWELACAGKERLAPTHIQSEDDDVRTKTEETDTIDCAADESAAKHKVLYRDGIPKLQDLLSLNFRGKRVRVIQDTASEWKHLAAALGFSGPRIDSIEVETFFKPRDACLKILSIWLDGDSELCEPVSWKTLIQCLIDAGLLDTAEDLEESLHTT